MRHVPIVFSIPCNLAGDSLQGAFKDLAIPLQRAFDKRLFVTDTKVTEVKSGSCNLSFKIYGFNDQVKARLMKQKGVLMITVWDSHGKVRKHVTNLLSGRSLEDEMGGCLVPLLNQSKDNQPKATSVLGDGRLGVDLVLAGAGTGTGQVETEAPAA